MVVKSKEKIKSKLHLRNKNRERYDLDALIKSTPELADYITKNKTGENTIDFSIAHAVRLLNQSILKHYYGIEEWTFPQQNLCPPIPGRAEYVHHIADLLSNKNLGNIPRGKNIICLDIGVGSTCIYPIIGVVEYGWRFIGSDISTQSISSSQSIINSNKSLTGMIELRLQKNHQAFLKNIVGENERIDVVICNPPFHASIKDAQAGTRRKIKNLSGKKMNIPKLNFSGMTNELVYKGGELNFISKMIKESHSFSKNCFVFSTLVSKKENLKAVHKILKQLKVTQQETISLSTGNKKSRFIAWTFLSLEEQKEWKSKNW